MNKTAIKNFSVWARKKLLDDVAYQAKQRGVSADGIATPLPQSTGDLQFFEIGTKSPARVTGEEINQRNALVDAIRRKERDSDYKSAYNAVIEEIAYTWFNRLVAIRFMEVNDYLPSRVRVLSAENPAKHEPDMVTTPFETDLEFTEPEQDMILRLKDQNKLDELFRFLFIRQCNKLHDILPKMFEQTSDYTEMLLNISFTDKDGIVYHLVHDIPEEDWQDQVQIIGWLYQYYNAEKKDEVFAALKKNVKITKENIPAATQLFTPDWIVRYMVENSLGRLWLEGHPNEGLKSGWKYYLDETEQEPEVQEQLDEIRKEYRTLNPQAIRVIDPCAGSGHILVYAFDVLMQIYESQGYTQRDAVQSILKNNLYGLDIDERASQLASFAVMMKARQYDRRIFSRGIQPHVYAIVESNDLSAMWKKGNRQIAKLFDCMKDAKEYGSILYVPEMDFVALRQQAKEKAENPDNLPAENVIFINQLPQVLALIDVAEALAQKYQITVTNPPYMGSSNMNPKLNNFIKEHYADYKADFFSAFIVRCKQMTVKNGYLGFFTPYVWMFIQSYEKLRKQLYTQATIETLIQFEYSAFEEATVPVCTFAFKNSYVAGKKGCYLRLTEFRGGMEVQRQKALEAIGNHECGFYFEQTSDNFSKIPGSPVAYWASDNLVGIFANEMSVDDIAQVKIGMGTGKNDIFVRNWWEIEYQEFDTSLDSIDQIPYSKGKWFPYNKGGDYRLWYGNLQEVLWFDKEGQKKMKTMSGHRENGGHDFYFKKGITWTFISSSNFGVRMRPSGSLFDVAGSTLFTSDKYFYYLLAFLSSNVCNFILGMLNPTLNYQAGNIKSLPVKFDSQQQIDKLSKNNVSLSRTDWDAFETSWDFKRHPLVANSQQLIADNYTGWENECNTRFNQLKENEEELNRIFIDIYGLQDELTPEVEDKDVTVRRADLGRDIRSLLSYAIGCMFGRYSLNYEGLAYAGGEWDDSRYGSFIPDRDNAIPITDEPYFEDDIVSLLCKWLTTVFGPSTLEENLKFIADALGNKGNTSREVIRNYFLNDFFKDHCKTYQKRPIYWLFDSGKQNGFKCLVYMHRWDADTAGNVRVEYLHKLQRIYEREIQRAQETIDEAHDTREVARANKRKDKLQKQLKETQDYDARLGHIALSRIAIDLDDGVKVNYEKVQTGKDGQKMPILAKIG